MTDEDDRGEPFRAAMARLAGAADRAAVVRTEARIPALVDLVEAAGSTPILLKGPVTRRRLYGPDEVRPVADIDLLVLPRSFRRVGRALVDAGFARVLVAGHSDTFLGVDGAVDLHMALPLTTVAPTRAFAHLSRHLVELDVDGRDVPVLDEPAHVVHLAVHAAQNDLDPAHRSFDEWRRGLESLSDGQAAAAAAVADEIGAEAAWDLARRALDHPASAPGLAQLLPSRRPGDSLASVGAFLRSPIPVRVKCRAVRTPLADQLSDHVVNAWRTKRGLAPLPPGTLAIRWAKVTRLVRATTQRITGAHRDR